MKDHKKQNLPKLTLIVGLTAAGKSTLSRQLAAERFETVFSLDQWMKTLFWMDSPPTPDLNWAIEMCERCLSMIESHVLQEINNKRGAILDLGFSKHEDRIRWINFARNNGASIEIIHLNVPQEERLKRVEKRNQALGPTDIKVDLQTFHWMESYFEPLTEDELSIAKVIAG